MDLEFFAVDKNKEINGVWRPIFGDAQVLVARAPNPQYRAAIVKYKKEICGYGVEPDPDGEDYDKIVTYAMAEAILLGWKNIKYKGKILEYSFKNAVMVLTEYPDFREAVSSISINRENFKPEKATKK